MPSELILGGRSARRPAVGFVPHARPESAGLITHSGDGHLITFARTGTGKTSGRVMCNALTHPGQLIVMDMKGEVHAATAQAPRAMGQEVHVLDLRDGGSHQPLRRVLLAGVVITAVREATHRTCSN